MSASGSNAARSQRVLVTGGAGFIGGNFVHYFANAHSPNALVVLDALTYAGNFSTIAPLVRSGHATFVHGDITDSETVERVLREHRIDTIVHFAAESHVDRSIVKSDAFVRTNVLGTHVLLEATRNAWYHDGQWQPNVRFHHVSTDEVYGSLHPHEPAFTEASPYAPNSPYAASKASADHLVRAWMHTYGLPASISNCSNNYGPYQFPEKLIPLTIVNALRGRPLPVYGDGRQIRDWLHVEDHCRAIAHMLDASAAKMTFNVGGHAEHENIDIVRRLCALLNAAFAERPSLREQYPDCPAALNTSCTELITHVKDRPGHDRRYAMNPTRIETELGFRPRESIDSGLARTLDWYLNHADWWRAVMDGSYRQWIQQQYGVTTN